MKCHYTYNETGYKFWLPLCYGGVYGEDFCSCSDIPTTWEGFEKQRYNEMVKSLQEEIKELKCENICLMKAIKAIKLTSSEG